MEGIAISTFLLIFFIVFPGIVLKRSYFRGEFSKQFNQGDFSDRLITTVFWGCLIQILILIIYSQTVDNSIGFEFLSDKANDFINYSNETNSDKSKDFKFISLSKEHLIPILIYLVLLIFVPYCVGLFAHNFVRLFKLDISSSALKFSNYWYYYFSGEIVQKKYFKSFINNPHLVTNGIEKVFVDVFADCGDGNKLYSGVFSQYTICKSTNKLEGIFLTDVKRYSDRRNQFVDIPGDIFHISENKIHNINIRYIAKSTTRLQRNKEYFLMILSLILLGINFIYPWFLTNNSIIRNISTIILGIIAIIFFIVLLYELLFRYRSTTVITTLTITLVFIFLLVSILNVANIL
ncbi:hypothetical protein [Chryseobacterium sp. GP-SGM7]|uniref:hypothetical protein n=1 Tax=Chryseobacterium sp. GP-SGM7 TaxID=3411323 RepID=UPI003B958620